MSARPRPLMAALALAAATSLALGAAPAVSAAAPVAKAKDPKGHDFPHPDLKKTYEATKKYKSEQAAIDDGYLRTDDCVEDPELGGMGYHYVKPANLGSTDPTRPAAILYAPDHKTGKRELVAVEWVVPNTGQPVPRIFDRNFDGPFDFPPVGPHYSLHAWIFKKNPKGVFTPYNPRVHCTPCTEDKQQSEHKQKP
ncbi:hypothetical protein [Streptomyces sp. SKN60]|uniref:hypothetical protein n=1 Tax=Streptomyces sp. SKN60 TaxID=2855506 RepID=UPI002245C529|nr:hypothetical protein [Streptomyces sp. SKN60]